MQLQLQLLCWGGAGGGCAGRESGLRLRKVPTPTAARRRLEQEEERPRCCCPR